MGARDVPLAIGARPSPFGCGMSLEPGTRLGPYEIVAPLGVGGMGEVYRARDTRLDRDVALKIVPDAFAGDPERLARFEREAKTLAALNHPNIAQIHGFEQSGDATALVMELVQGEDLAQLIGSSPLPVDEVLPIARQIADALEAAHEQGIIHRDLKPANVRIRPDGSVKVLDFGLAKVIDVGDVSPTNAGRNSPTITTPANITVGGVVLGTPAYMAPEQARGKPVDKRADIWAFGCVLYEMLTGRAPFAGATTSDVLARVLEREPDWSTLPHHLPDRLRETMRQCLVKDPRHRTRDIGDVRIALDGILTAPVERAAAQRDSRPGLARTGLSWVFALTTLAASATAVWLAWRPAAPEPPGIRAVLDLENNTTLFTAVGPAVVFSPDGRLLAFVGSLRGHLPQLYVRRLDSLQPVALGGTSGARDAFFSPDGDWIGFFADGKLKKIATRGGAVVTLADASNDRGGDWLDRDTIVFAQSGESALTRVAAAGGAPSPLTALADGELSHRWPHILPGGRGVIFTALGNASAGPRVIAQRIPDGERKVLLPSAYFARYLPSGHLVYMQDSTLYGVPFDPETLTIRGSAVPFEEGVLSNPNTLSAQVAFSARGAMLYVPGGASATARMFWIDATGAATPIGTASGRFSGPRLSPDGNRVAVTIVGPQSDIWIYDWTRDALSRLSFAEGDDVAPVWSPDGQSVAFASETAPGVPSNVFVRQADGTGEAVRLIESAKPQIPASWHPSGRFLAMTATEDKTSRVLIASLTMTPAGLKAGTPQPFAAGPFSQAEPAFSSDGRWIAYQANETGRYEVYVRPFPGPGGRWQVSTAGGTSPIWAGKDSLFFRNSLQEIMVVTCDGRSDAFSTSPPRRWSDERLADLGPFNRSYDMHPNGTRALVLGTDPAHTAARNRLVFVSNIAEELRREASER